MPPRAGELDRVALDCAAARRVLGWRPQTSLADGIVRTIDWIRRRAAVASI